MIRKSLSKLLNSWWLAHFLSLMGGIVYLAQAWIYAHTQTSFLDEGGYLYIGNLYARGILKPFQDFTIPRWYAPLVYLVPGQVEAWFGPGLRTGRYFSIFCSIMMLIALWLTAKRLGNKWWGAAIVWSIVLTPVAIQVYSLAISQALVACLLAWSLMFVLGDKRSLWQIIAGSILAGLTVMTRNNLMPLVLLLVIYVFWHHGKKAGWWALAGCLLPILIINLIYWPNILQIWAIWLPARLTPFLEPFRFPVVDFTPQPVVSLRTRVFALAQGFRFHYFSMFGFLATILLWPRRNEWKSKANKHAAFFLAALFLILAIMHAWATSFSTEMVTQCTFCFTPYLSFFDLTALLLVVVTFSSWRKKVSWPMQAVIILMILILSPALGYASFDRFGDWLLAVKFPAITRGLNPALWFPTITLWDILANKFKLDYPTSRVFVPLTAGFLLGALLMIVVAVVKKWWNKKSKRIPIYSFGARLLIVCLGAGFVLSPLMGGIYREEGVCRADILQTYEQVGSTLAGLIPPNSQVYWEASTATPLLTMPDVKIHPTQVYGMYSFRKGGESQQIDQHGLWNDELAARWQAGSDFIILQANWYPPGGHRPGGALDTTLFEEFQTASINPCNPNSFLYVYRRK